MGRMDGRVFEGQQGGIQAGLQVLKHRRCANYYRGYSSPFFVGGGRPVESLMVAGFST